VFLWNEPITAFIEEKGKSCDLIAQPLVEAWPRLALFRKLFADIAGDRL
jgi:hypothetical protein